MFSKNLSIPVFLFISTLYLKLGNKRKMIAVSSNVVRPPIGRFRTNTESPSLFFK